MPGHGDRCNRRNRNSNWRNIRVIITFKDWPTAAVTVVIILFVQRRCYVRNPNGFDWKRKCSCCRVSDAAILNVKTVAVMITLQHLNISCAEVDSDRFRSNKLLFPMLKIMVGARNQQRGLLFYFHSPRKHVSISRNSFCSLVPWVLIQSSLDFFTGQCRLCHFDSYRPLPCSTSDVCLHTQRECRSKKENCRTRNNV